MNRFKLPSPSHVEIDRFVLVRMKGKERYIFAFDRHTKDECLKRAGQYADNPDLSFDWGDVVALTKEVRRRCK